MQTEVRSPLREPAVPPVSAPPRRRGWVPWTALWVVAVFLLSAVVFLEYYDPLCHGPCTGVSGVHGPTVHELGHFTSPTGDDFSAFQVVHRPGQEFSFWVTLSNEGRFGITVTHVGDTPQPYDRYSVVRVQTQPIAGQQALRDFRPFSLAPSSRQFVDVLVTMRMRNCVQTGETMTFGSVPVTYTVLGITHHTTVYLGTSIAVVGAPETVCQL